jgi:hypothetical protein
MSSFSYHQPEIGQSSIFGGLQCRPQRREHKRTCTSTILLIKYATVYNWMLLSRALREEQRHTLVEACVVMAAVQPSPTLTVHEIVSPWQGRAQQAGEPSALQKPSTQARAQMKGSRRERKGGGTHGDDAAAVGEGVEPDGVAGGGADLGGGDELERVPSEAAGQRRPPPHLLHTHHPRRRRHRRLTTSLLPLIDSCRSVTLIGQLTI